MQPTKQGWLYVFDRITGQPVWPIEERPVEKGTVPGEWYSPTQPFVTKPPAYEVQGVLDERSDRLHAGAESRGAEARSRTTRSVRSSPRRWSAPGRGRSATLMLPAATGGANWQGGAFDPETKMFYIFTNNAVTALGLAPPAPGRSDMAYVQGIGPQSGGGGSPGRRRAARVPADGAPAPAVPRRRRRRRPDGSGTAAHQAALRADLGDRREQGRPGVADRARRDAGQHQESPGAQGV